MQEALVQPIVSCPLGKLYNKESLISYLLSPTTAFGHDGHLIASHIRSLKDVTTLHLTPNPALSSISSEELAASTHVGTQEARPTSLFVCPISLREMNGAVPFVYRVSTGSVMSLSSLKEMRKANGDLTLDPVTGINDKEGTKEEEWVVINPKEEAMEMMRDEFEARKIREREEKRVAKERKRKSKPDGGEVAASSTKKVKLAMETTSNAEVSVKIPVKLSLSDTLTAKIAAEKKNQSPAILSLYADKNADPNKDSGGRSTWMTRGCYSRYA